MHFYVAIAAIFRVKLLQEYNGTKMDSCIVPPQVPIFVVLQ